MKNIIIFGTGAVAAELETYITTSNWGKLNGYKVKGFVASDDFGKKHWIEYKLNMPYFGHIDNYIIDDNDYFILALGNYAVKRLIAQKIKDRKGKFVTFIHPTAIIAPTAVVGEGCILYPFTILGPNVVLGNFNLLTTQSIISHDCVVGNYNFFATALLCGYNKVGDDNYFGIRGTTLPNIEIGSKNTIQAGMIVDKNIENESTCFYRFKEKVLAIPKVD